MSFSPRGFPIAYCRILTLFKRFSERTAIANITLCPLRGRGIRGRKQRGRQEFLYRFLERNWFVFFCSPSCTLQRLTRDIPRVITVCQSPTLRFSITTPRNTRVYLVTIISHTEANHILDSSQPDSNLFPSNREGNLAASIDFRASLRKEAYEEWVMQFIKEALKQAVRFSIAKS